MTKYKCKYCGKEFESLLVCIIHELDKCEKRPKDKEQSSFSFTLSGVKA